MPSIGRLAHVQVLSFGCHPAALVLAVGSAQAGDAGSPVVPSVRVTKVNTSEVKKYEKLEIELELAGVDIKNSFDPDEIDVFAKFTSPDGKTIRINGFYDNYKDVNKWKIRFSPGKVGQWKYQVFARDAKATGESASAGFTAIASDRHGWIHPSMMYAIWPHDLFSQMVWSAKWSTLNPYSKLCNVTDVYSDPIIWEYQKKLYRYLVARFGHSETLGIWELINEMNGTDGWAKGKEKECYDWVEKCQKWFAENDPYRHPMTASFSGGYGEYREPLPGSSRHRVQDFAIAKGIAIGSCKLGTCKQ
jgi:hypothetical protein